MNGTSLTTPRTAARVRVTGVVQGVGFRPYVHRLATRLGLAGAVRNLAGAVQIDVEGPPRDLEAFLDQLVGGAPPLARIERVIHHPLAPTGARRFEILPSRAESGGRLPVSPDAGICPACEAELFDPGDRRYWYPFITCSDCGPRFTVITALPYDRARTTMRAFRQCAACRTEYQTPANRRYHSETNSCPDCGPRLWLVAPDLPAGAPQVDHLAEAARALAAGRIVALRGLGGFHLAVDATDQRAVLRLRRRKRREAKPLAIMVRTVAEARAIGRVGPVEARLLASRERPIVLLPRRRAAGIAAAVAPGLDTLGVMLPATPLHHLLLAQVRRPLVMTSGNVSNEPIATSNTDAVERLGRIADLFLVHDREIVARYDDSVLRVVAGAPLLLRRARGYAPLPLDLPVESPVPLVATGAQFKNTFTLATGRVAFVSQHLGDLDDVDTAEHFEATLASFRRLFRIEPAVAVRDLHPEYLSTRLAAGFGLDRVVPVQHHHAHVAAVAAEYGVRDPVVGIAYDGAGYGDDGVTWGSEILVADLAGYRRMAHLRYAPLPGGDLAARRSWRAAVGYLSLEPGTPAPCFRNVPPQERDLVERQLAAGLNVPLASSMGRLFDAAAAILGVRSVQHYEGHAAMELEAAAGRRPGAALPFPVVDRGPDGWLLDPVPLLAALIERRRAGDQVRDLAAGFHESVAAATAEVAGRVAEATGISTVALGGGVFQNARLLDSVRRRLERLGLRVLVPRVLSPNDGAISFGQAAVAAAILRRDAGGG